MNLSPLQLIDIWSELEDAWNKRNGYGTDTAEIYVYKLAVCPPTYWLSKDEKSEREVGAEAAKNLYSILKIFQEKRSCQITINDKPFGDWLLTEPLYYRCYIRVAVI